MSRCALSKLVVVAALLALAQRIFYFSLSLYTTLHNSSGAHTDTHLSKVTRGSSSSSVMLAASSRRRSDWLTFWLSDTKRLHTVSNGTRVVLKEQASEKARSGKNPSIYLSHSCSLSLCLSMSLCVCLCVCVSFAGSGPTFVPEYNLHLHHPLLLLLLFCCCCCCYCSLAFLLLSGPIKLNASKPFLRLIVLVCVCSMQQEIERLREQRDKIWKYPELI